MDFIPKVKFQLAKISTKAIKINFVNQWHLVQQCVEYNTSHSVLNTIMVCQMPLVEDSLKLLFWHNIILKKEPGNFDLENATISMICESHQIYLALYNAMDKPAL